MESIQPAAEVSNFSSSSELSCYGLLRTGIIHSLLSSFTENIRDVGEDPGSLTFLCVFLPSTSFSIEGAIAVKASSSLEEVSMWKHTSCLPFLLDVLEFVFFLSVKPLHWC